MEQQLVNTTTIRKPKVKIPQGEKYEKIKALAKDLKLATVCQEARCPNIGECWESGTATFMLMGDVCTRGCKFCAVKTGNPKGKLDNDEPENIGLAISQMDLSYVVLTSVDRDDLPDEGADHFARTVEVIRKNNSKMLIEVLAPDFSGKYDSIYRLTMANPDVYAHNVETVKRLTPVVRDRRCTYQQSLYVLKTIKAINPKVYTKTSIMLGLGEQDDEVIETLKDLREIGCDAVTFGQYLRPTFRHLKVIEYLTDEKFAYWEKTAKDLGFMYVASGPLVRSSYKAFEHFMDGKQRLGG